MNLFGVHLTVPRTNPFEHNCPCGILNPGTSHRQRKGNTFKNGSLLLRICSPSRMAQRPSMTHATDSTDSPHSESVPMLPLLEYTQAT